ncbi:MAG: DUF2892 domain-containing protein [Candidatus Goldbacteria bacterium]|nr:DUF2892 domain-containing protein [Candidatus Goldiibacteriota bacterium]
MFKVNEGPIDRIVRSILGIGLIAGGFFVKGIISIVLWVAGGILLLTGITGFCGLYVLLGINTCPVNKK